MCLGSRDLKKNITIDRFCHFQNNLLPIFKVNFHHFYRVCSKSIYLLCVHSRGEQVEEVEEARERTGGGGGERVPGQREHYEPVSQV